MSPHARQVVCRPGLLLLVGFLVIGCATPAFRAPPQFQTRVGRLNTVAMIPPTVKVYSLSAGAVKEEIDEWSSTARENMRHAVEALLTTHADFVVTPFKPAATLPPLSAVPPWSDLDDTKALYKVVSASIFLHTYRQDQTFPQKVEAFDYTLGPQVRALADQAQADALLFVDAIDHISTGGRQALMALGILAGLATGVFVTPGGGGTVISVALVEGQSGDILWYNILGAGGAYDLRNPQSCAQLVQALLRDFPGMQSPNRNRP